MLGETTACYLDLALLSPPNEVLALIVAAEKQDDPLALGVAEDPQ